jgi:tRNA A37 threonylcarbamoyladenosine modification protein TsaB
MAHRAIGVGVSGLQALAYAASNAAADEKTPLLVLADTRREPIYVQIFDAEAQPLCPIFETSIHKLPQLIDAGLTASGLRVIGMERMAVADALSAAGIITDLPEIDEMPNASMVARLASRQIVQQQIAPLSPLYLSDPRLGPGKNTTDDSPPAHC